MKLCLFGGCLAILLAGVKLLEALPRYNTNKTDLLEDLKVHCESLCSNYAGISEFNEKLKTCVCYVAKNFDEEDFGDVDSCGGRLQSPINLRTEDFIIKPFKSLAWSEEYGTTPISMTAGGGGSLLVAANYTEGRVPKISGGPLFMPYKLVQFHFHWALSDDRGSEHRVNGRRYIMELHALHIKETMEFAEAAKDPDGIAVVAYFFEYSSKNNSAISKIINAFTSVKKDPKAQVKLTKNFPIDKLVKPITCNYVTYRGSLTTRPCTENVRWFISPYTDAISEAQMAQFRTLAPAVPANNYRLLQKTNKRKIYYAVEYKQHHINDEYPDRKEYNDEDGDNEDGDDEEGERAGIYGNSEYKR